MTSAPHTRIAARFALLPALACCWLWPAPAHASFGPIQLQSVGPQEQFESASGPAISGDGRYLAFAGVLKGRYGIWRRELQTGRLQFVASGSNPSISSDGRYVSFDSGERLVTQAHVGGNVYVRDMAIEPAFEGPCTGAQEAGGRCPYELASALSGTLEGIGYEGGGASALARVALSANGREVAFVVGSVSNLMGPGTPAEQIAVRFLDTRETVLVSAEREASSGRMVDRPVAGGATLSGAALSGDGSTVAWLGKNIPAQVPTLKGEGEQIELDDNAPASSNEAYNEPLWRRIADGPAAPTRRMVGGGDPLAPGCPSDGTIEIPACQGPYPTLPFTDTRGEEATAKGWLGKGGYDEVPALSYDGWTAALVGDPDSTANVFAVDMHEGLDRDQALRELTPEVPQYFDNPGNTSQYLPVDGNVYQVAISPDGTRIAFTTQRQLFPLAPLVYAGEPPSQMGVVELYQIVDQEVLERVTHGPNGGPSLEAGNQVLIAETGASEPSYSDDDATIAFADTASNLVYGDSNRASDVFTVSESEALGQAPSVRIGPPPAGQEPAPLWQLSLVAVPLPDGDATLDVVVPAPGAVSASASATVPVSVPTPTARGPARASKAAGRRRRKLQASATLATRTVGSAHAQAADPGLLELPLRIGSRYAGLLGTAAGLYATVRVTFVGAGGPPLERTLTLSLRRSAHPGPRRGPRRAKDKRAPRRASRPAAGRRRGRAR